jgi:hypothetical protein
MADLAGESALGTGEHRRMVASIRLHARVLLCALIIDAIKFEID